MLGLRLRVVGLHSRLPQSFCRRLHIGGTGAGFPRMNEFPGLHHGQPLVYSHLTVMVTVAECAVAPEVAVRLTVDVVPLLLPPLQEAKAKTNNRAKTPAKLGRRG